MNKAYRHFAIPFLCIAVWLGGCASDPAFNQTAGVETTIRYGQIVRIDPTTLEGDHQLGVGAIMGAAVGGLLGSHIGQGSGATVAAVMGALGGGYLGNEMQNKYADKRAGSHIMVRLDNGVMVSVTQPADANLRVGDRVMVQESGQKARVVRA